MHPPPKLVDDSAVKRVWFPLRALVAALGRVPPVLWVYCIFLYVVYRKARSLGLDSTERKRQVAVRGTTLGVFLTRDEDDLRSSVVDPARITDTLDSVGGLAEVKRVVDESLVMPLARPHLFPAGSLRSPPKGLLLHGPPGTGKTLLARAIAREAQCVFIAVTMDTVFSKWVGESEKRVAALFSLARKLSPTIIFVDEIESLLGQRGSASETPSYNHVKTLFLTEWDGLLTDDAVHRVVVVGATNRPGDIDEAVLRRMPVKLQVDYPSHAERTQILRIILGKDSSLDAEAIGALPFAEISRRCDGYSGSDLRELCKEAAMCAVREQVSMERAAAGGHPAAPRAAGAPSGEPTAEHKLGLRLEHFMRALQVVRSNEGFVYSSRCSSGFAAPSYRAQPPPAAPPPPGPGAPELD